MSGRLSIRKPFILGLTGSIGMGKSTVADMFREFGVPVFDADAAVHAMQGVGGTLVNEIETAFPGTTGPEGVDRQELGSRVLGNKAQMLRLEAIVHPAVARRRADFLADNIDSPLVLFDIPLLYEKGGADAVHAIAVVSAPAPVQRSRVLSRPLMDETKFARILDLQMPDAQKRERADYIIDTGIPISQTRDIVRRVVTKLSQTLV